MRGTAWLLSKKAEEAPDGDVADNLFYVFVSLNGAGAPSYHIVPRITVAEYIRGDHAKWLSTLGKGGPAVAETYRQMVFFSRARRIP